jgi:hypothetical protein
MHAKLNLPEFPKSPIMVDIVHEDPIQPDHTYKDQHQPQTQSQNQSMTQNHKQADAYNDSFSPCILWGHRTFLSGNAGPVPSTQQCPVPSSTQYPAVHSAQRYPVPCSTQYPTVPSTQQYTVHVAISIKLAIHNVSEDPTKVAKYENSSKPEFEVSTRVAKYEYTSHQTLSFPNKLHSFAAISLPLVLPSKYENVSQQDPMYKTDKASERYKNKSSSCALVTPRQSKTSVPSVSPPGGHN